MTMPNQSYLKLAEARMTENIPKVFLEHTIADIKQMFSKKEFETLNYVYVLDKNNVLKGVFSIRELFLKPDNTKAKEIMKTTLIKGRPGDEQERIAILALKHNLKAIPIVDKENKFLGVVPPDAILGILHLEHVEDFLRSAGIHSAVRETFEGTPIFLARARLPWLILGLFGGLAAAAIIEVFEGPLKTYFLLAAFIPLMVYMADAVGAQTQTLFIRNLVLESQPRLGQHILRELKTGIIIAVFLALFLSLFSFAWFRPPYFIGITLGISLLLTILGAMAIGVLIPWLLWKFKKDPAVGAGPFGTIARDLLSLIIYFGVASLILLLAK